jgi:hypothetical protein
MHTTRDMTSCTNVIVRPASLQYLMVTRNLAVAHFAHLSKDLPNSSATGPSNHLSRITCPDVAIISFGVCARSRTSVVQISPP